VPVLRGGVYPCRFGWLKNRLYCGRFPFNYDELAAKCAEHQRSARITRNLPLTGIKLLFGLQCQFKGPKRR
jgi:hypothetical protein